MLNISIKTIPHKTQRYDTAGDWYDHGKQTRFRISDMHNSDYEFLVAVHEMIEQHLCKKRGITEKMVDAFDMGPGKNMADPGCSKKAPYHKEHMFGMKIEKLLAKELGVKWNPYCDAFELLK